MNLIHAQDDVIAQLQRQPLPAKAAKKKETNHWHTWRPKKENLHLPGLREMVATAKDGECPFCGEPAKKRSMTKEAVALRKKTAKRAGKKVTHYFLTCGEPECAQAYFRCWNRERCGVARPFKKLKNQRGLRKYTKHLSDLSGTHAP